MAVMNMNISNDRSHLICLGVTDYKMYLNKVLSSMARKKVSCYTQKPFEVALPSVQYQLSFLFMQIINC